MIFLQPLTCWETTSNDATITSLPNSFQSIIHLQSYYSMLIWATSVSFSSYTSVQSLRFISLFVLCGILHTQCYNQLQILPGL
jgi:hypothetical protein